jgi:hypothetical protein
MKKFILSFVLLFVLFFNSLSYAYEKVSVNITAQNTFSASVRIKGPGLVIISDTGSFSGTVTLQASGDNGTTWADIKEWTAEAVDSISDGANQLYRIGVKTGDFSGGTATLYLIEAR